MKIQVDRWTGADTGFVLEWVVRLLKELGEEEKDLGSLQADKVLQEWKRAGDRFQVFVAREAENDSILGILTLAESFAIYANGNYGIINEMYVAPEFRSLRVGARLLEAVRDYGISKGWTRIDVTAPESERWNRTRRFYEDNGYTFAGPKLKLLLS